MISISYFASINKMVTKIIAAGGIVFNENNDILLIYRRGFWDLPKGKLDDGESIESCALREVCEETGISFSNLSIKEFAGITNHEYFDKYLQNDVLKETHWFYMQLSGDNALIPQTEEDIEEIRWVALQNLPAYFDKTYKNIVDILSPLL